MMEKIRIKFFLILFSLLVSSLALSTHISDSVSPDRTALMELYEATGGDDWTDNSGWGSDQPLGNWYGIETNSEGRVTRVDLWHNNLEGTIENVPWDNLKKVKYLNLKYNHLTGPIPPELGSMSALEVLILQGRTYPSWSTEEYWKEPMGITKGWWGRGYHQGKYYSNTNEFSGQIPAQIGNLSNLIVLEISNAINITGPIPPGIGNLSNLKGLYLSGANFAGHTIPSSFGNLTNLKHLYIEGAGLTGELPASFQNLTKLTIVNLSVFDRDKSNMFNELTGPLPDFSQFTDLQELVLTNNEFTGEFPQYLNNGNFKQLNLLYLAGNNLTGDLPALNNLPNLNAFDVKSNNLTGNVDVLTDLPESIRIIMISHNNIGGSFPQSGWPNYTRLKTVAFGANPISGNIPCSFWQKLDNPKLNFLRFGAMPKINDACPSAAKAMKGDGSINMALP